MTSENSLWMGDIEPWMNEFFIKNSFIESGFNPKTIKFIKDKKSNILQNYCFIIFDNLIDASNALKQLNGTKIPHTKINFKLNWANKNGENGKTVYVGNLSSKINDLEFYKFFKDRYQSVSQASVVTENGVSKKYGFVYFNSEEDYQKCLTEMDGVLFHKNIIRVKERKKKNNGNEFIKKTDKIMNKKVNNVNNSLNNNIIFCHKINNINFLDKHNRSNNFNHFNIPSINLNEIKSFFPKNKRTGEYCKTENDDTTFSSQDKDQDLSSSNSNISKKRKFSDNIELLESDDNKILYKKAQESINKTFEYYKNNNRSYEISNMILYYTSNNNHDK